MEHIQKILCLVCVCHVNVTGKESCYQDEQKKAIPQFAGWLFFMNVL
jgi:hypothetical protein